MSEQVYLDWKQKYLTLLTDCINLNIVSKKEISVLITTCVFS